MNRTRVVTLTFSPNGTTRQVSDAIAQGIGAPERLELDRTAFDSRWTGETLRPGDVAVIALPVYYGRLPKLMVEFFRYIRAEGIPAVLAVTYGNRDYEDTLLELRNESRAHGFVPVAAGAFVTHHCMAGKLAEGRPNGDDLAQARELGEQAAALLAGLDSLEGLELHVKGSFPYTPGSDLPVGPGTDPDKCTGCGLCQRNCPVQAINPLDPAEIDGWRCLFCTRCIHSCPAGAKFISLPAMREKLVLLENMMAQPKENERFLI